MSAAINPILRETKEEEPRKPLVLVPNAGQPRIWRDGEPSPLLVVSAAVVFALVGATALMATIMTMLALRGSAVMAP